MAETDEMLQRAEELVRIAEGFMSDAEFREEHEMRQIRYLQAMCNGLIALSIQNQVMIDLLQKQGRYGA